MIKGSNQNFPVSEYRFSSLEKASISVQQEFLQKEVTEYQFHHFDQGKMAVAKETQQKQLRIERSVAKEQGFLISPIVIEHRGIKKNQDDEIEKMITDEVEKRLLVVRKSAEQQGFKEGIERGKEEVFQQMMHAVEEKMLLVTDMINQLLKSKEKILQEQRLQIFSMIKNLTKWVILRELENDGEYVQRLLGRLITELQTSNNLFIQVSKNSFDKMPEVLEEIEKQFGKLPNVRFEIDYDIHDNGLIVHSENGILNGTLEEQFKILSKLFVSVGLTESSDAG